MDRHWNSEGFRDAEQAAEYRLRAREWVADYLVGPGADATPVALERWVSVPTARIVAEGRADRIDERGRELVVVDYKTGRPPGPDDAHLSPALALYALGARHTLRRPCSRVELHHVPTGEVVAADHDETSLQAHVVRAEDAAQDIADAVAAASMRGAPDVLFPPRPAPRCGSCDVRRHCPEGRAAAPEREPWASLAP